MYIYTPLLVNNTRGDSSLRLLILSLLTVWNPFRAEVFVLPALFPRACIPRISSAGFRRRVTPGSTASSPAYGNRDRNEQVYAGVFITLATVLIVVVGASDTNDSESVF